MAVYGEVGRYPLYINRSVRIIKYWCKLQSNDNVIVSSLFTSMLNSCESGVKNWAYNVKLLLNTYGFGYVWNNPSAFASSSFPLIFKQRVVDVFMQQWGNAIANLNGLYL